MSFEDDNNELRFEDDNNERFEDDNNEIERMLLTLNVRFNATTVF